MLIELITPLMLATAPPVVDVPLPTYSHSVQGSMEPMQFPGTSTHTANGTQTFDFNGKPRDADSDNDSD